jgi:hypothetical protein
MDPEDYALVSAHLLIFMRPVFFSHGEQLLFA